MNDSRSLGPSVCAIFCAGVLSNPVAMAAQDSDSWTADWMMLAGIAVIAYAIWRVLRLLDK